MIQDKQQCNGVNPYQNYLSAYLFIIVIFLNNPESRNYIDTSQDIYIATCNSNDHPKMEFLSL